MGNPKKNGCFWTLIDRYGGPGCLIIICGAAGFFIGGPVGILGGLFAGWLLSMLASLLIHLAQGGPIPRKWREKLVSITLEEQIDLVREVFPNISEKELNREVAKSINKVFQRAAWDYADQKEYSMTRQNVMASCEKIREEEMNPRKKVYWEELGFIIEDEVYQRSESP